MLPHINQILACGGILFMLGLKDDIAGLTPFKKFIGQFIAAAIIAVAGDIRFVNLNGIMGLYELTYPFSISLTIFAIVGIVNSFNLIDGVDGLAGCIGLIMSLTYAFLFYQAGDTGWVYLSLSFAGAIAGFLVFNIAPARIFMGDSGSLLIGFFAAVMSIHFIELTLQQPVEAGDIRFKSGYALVLSVLMVPLFDTVRVFTLRVLNNTSPFKADRNHLHHKLLEAGMSHTQVTLTLSVISAGMIAASAFLQYIGDNQLIITLVLAILVLNTGFTLYLTGTKKVVGEEALQLLPEKNFEPGQDLLDELQPGKKAAAPNLTAADKSFANKVISQVFRN
nr:MraY family glycosyltransferase [Hufsiella ginkgonis]